ncbi:hypothetical protein AB0B69_01230 [Micromonospora parva]
MADGPVLPAGRMSRRHVVAINGPSYRLKNRLTAIDDQANIA